MRVWGRILHCLYRYREIFILDRVGLSCSFFLCPSSTFIFSYSPLFQYSPCFFHVIISNSPLRLSARTHVGTRKSTPWAGGLNEVQSPTRRWRRLVVGQQYQQFGVRSPPCKTWWTVFPSAHGSPCWYVPNCIAHCWYWDRCPQRKVYLEDETKGFWDSVDARLKLIRSTANGDARKITR